MEQLGRQKSLESTYKELKPNISFYIISLYIGLESTYKELKPVYFFKYFHCIYRLESTYKELKRGGTRSVSQSDGQV